MITKINIYLNKYTKNKGFTLVELLIVIGLTGFAIGITADILLSVTRSYNKTQVINELEQQASIISLKLNKELKNSVNIIEPSEVNKPSNQLTFITQIDNVQKEISYSIRNNVLYRTEDGIENPLTFSEGLQGINVVCESEDNCFTLINRIPFVLNYDLIFKKPDEFAISLDLPISNTVVVRSSY